MYEIEGKKAIYDVIYKHLEKAVIKAHTDKVKIILLLNQCYVKIREKPTVLNSIGNDGYYVTICNENSLTRIFETKSLLEQTMDPQFNRQFKEIKNQNE